MITLRRQLGNEVEKLVSSTVFWVAPFVLTLFLSLMLFGFEVHAAKNGVIISDTEHSSHFTGSVIVSVYSAGQKLFINTANILLSPLNVRIGERETVKKEDVKEEIAKPKKAKRGGTSASGRGKTAKKRALDHALLEKIRAKLATREKGWDGMVGDAEEVLMHDIIIEILNEERRVLQEQYQKELKKMKKTFDEDVHLRHEVIGEFSYLRTLVMSLLHPKPLPRPRNTSELEKEEDVYAIGFFDFLVGKAFAADEMPVKPLYPIDESDTFMMKVQKRLQWLMEPVRLDQMLIDRARYNGMRFTYLSLYFAFVFIFPVITVSVVAQMFAGEFATGTIKTCLLRSTTRNRLLLSKLLVLAAYLLLLLFFFIVCTILLGIWFAGYGNLVMDSQLLGSRGSERYILGDGAILLFIAAVPVATLSLLPLASFAVLFSYLKADQAAIIGTTSLVYYILFTLGDLPLFEDINFLFFTTYMNSWMLLFDLPFPVPSFLFKLTILSLMTAGVLIIVNYISDKKDIYA